MGDFFNMGVWTWLLLIKTSNKFIYIWICRIQYFCNAVCWWPSWLSVFWTAFAFVKCCWVQTTESCQSRTWHFLRRCEFVDCIPYVIVRHSSLLFLTVCYFEHTMIIKHVFLISFILFLWHIMYKKGHGTWKYLYFWAFFLNYALKIRFYSYAEKNIFHWLFVV